MNKVTTINLSGRAFQVEERGYDTLQKYLQSAQTKLAENPDKDEIMQDLERAIADKCAALITEHKDVITVSEVKSIITAMGEVDEPQSEKEGHGAETPTLSGQTPPKRLYLLKDGAMIGGVCNGLAAYFNLDVTIVRLIFVILAFATSGFWVLVYLIMMLVIPEAVTPEQKAELRGERFTAQDVVNRAKQKYADLSDKEHWRKVGKDSAPALQATGTAMLKIVRALFAVIAIIVAIAIAFLTTSWIATLWWLVMGNVQFADQLQTIPVWAVAFASSMVYLLLVLPLVVVMRLCIMLAQNQTIKKAQARWNTTVVITWVIALGILVGIFAAYQSRVYEYQQSHGYIDVNGKHYCINDALCNHTPIYDNPVVVPQPIMDNPLQAQ